MTDFTDAELREAEHYLEGSIVPVTGMCGPCTFGEADTADGNW